MEFTFTPRDNDTLEEWALQFSEMYLHRKPVKMLIDMSQCSTLDIKKMVGLKCIIDSHRKLTREYLIDTTIKVQDPLLKTFIRSVLVFFKPERPVYLV